MRIDELPDPALVLVVQHVASDDLSYVDALCDAFSVVSARLKQRHIGEQIYGRFHGFWIPLTSLALPTYCDKTRYGDFETCVSCSRAFCGISIITCDRCREVLFYDTRTRTGREVMGPCCIDCVIRHTNEHRLWIAVYDVPHLDSMCRKLYGLPISDHALIHKIPQALKHIDYDAVD